MTAISNLSGSRAAIPTLVESRPTLKKVGIVALKILAGMMVVGGIASTIGGSFLLTRLAITATNGLPVIGIGVTIGFTVLQVAAEMLRTPGLEIVGLMALVVAGFAFTGGVFFPIAFGALPGYGVTALGCWAFEKLDQKAEAIPC